MGTQTMTWPTGTELGVQTAVFSVVTLEDREDGESYLALIARAQTELEAIEAGMWNQNRSSGVGVMQQGHRRAQQAAKQDIVQAALADGVSSVEITKITYRNVFDTV